MQTVTELDDDSAERVALRLRLEEGEQVMEMVACHMDVSVIRAAVELGLPHDYDGKTAIS